MNIRQLGDIGAWRAFAPNLHITDVDGAAAASEPLTFPDARDLFLHLLSHEGYLHVRNINWRLDLALLASTVRALSEASLLPVFAFLFDEFWAPFHKLHALYAAILGDYAMLPDFWVWNVDPRKADAGWKPHRDKGHMALLPDGSPKSLTTWIPLSPATPLNGCMYIVPPRLDPTYGTADEKQWRFEYPSVRALPAAPGEALIWNQAVLHWGGKTSSLATESRVSLAFEFQRLDVEPFNRPLIRPRMGLSFELRLKLVAKQILQYRHMYQFDPAMIAWADDIAGTHAEHLSQ